MFTNFTKIILLVAAKLMFFTGAALSETQRNCSFLEDYYFQKKVLLSLH